MTQNNGNIDPQEQDTLNQQATNEAADVNATANISDDDATQTEGENAADATQVDPVAELQQKYDALRADYLRLMADFDNYRKNTLKEKQNLLKYGGEEALKKLLPVVDDFERAMASLETATDISPVKEGVGLIYNKFTGYLDQNGVKAIPAAQGDVFDDTKHDAMTMFPAPTPELKGKIVDCVTKGYMLNDKVIRYAKVVVGQ